MKRVKGETLVQNNVENIFAEDKKIAHNSHSAYFNMRALNLFLVQTLSEIVFKI
jgi:hypothetical protein